METIEENILNVTLLEPRQKHPAIFVRYDELMEGESLTILNDHDPKPLYYQLLGERGNTFVWEYLEEGPELWRVRISKRVAGEKDETLGQIAAKDLRKALIFKKHGLDFCCGGKKTIKQACAEKGLDVTLVEKELQLVDNAIATRPLPYNEWSLDFLTDYILNTHHTYVRKSLPDLKYYASKVAKVHGAHHPELLSIHQLVESVNTELTAHMITEEKVLFPYVKDLVTSQNNGSPVFSSHFDSVLESINTMESEHEFVGKSLAEIRSLSANYVLPEDACASYSLLYRMLEEFEGDLHTHVHLENNILFPKAIELEKTLIS